MYKYQPSRSLEIKSIDITFDTVETKWSRKTPRSIRNKVEEIHCFAKDDPKRAIHEILKVNKKHKNIPVLNNYLCSCYLAINDIDNAKKIASQNYKLFPRYLFAKTNFAQICINTNKVDQIPSIFGSSGKRVPSSM
ncbi:MAG: hypothetical protein OEV64_12680 [Desulfobulbaceae bacterium]|nr:hypothetical protein [Desulfobulbaceae bacterium]